MRVRFEANYKDYGETAFLIWRKNNAGSSEPFKSFLLFAFFAAVTSIPAFLFAPHFIYTVLNFSVVFTLGYYLYKPVNLSYFVQFYRSVYKEDSYPVEVELFENGVEITMPAAKVFYEWRNVAGFDEAEEKLSLFFRFQTGISIPKHCFQTISEVGDFIAFTRAHISTNQTNQLNDRNNQWSAQIKIRP